MAGRAYRSIVQFLTRTLFGILTLNIIGGILAAALIILLANAAFVVPLDRQALVLRFGQYQYAVNADPSAGIGSRNASSAHPHLPTVLPHSNVAPQRAQARRRDSAAVAELLIRGLWTHARRGESRHCWIITFVPTGTRANRSVISSLTRRKQPDDTAWPIVSGGLVPWMR